MKLSLVKLSHYKASTVSFKVLLFLNIEQFCKYWAASKTKDS
jgi:hypothetical protein